MVGFQWMTKWSVEVDCVCVVAAILGHRQISRFGEVGDNAVHRSFTDTNEFCYFAESDVWIFGDTDQHVGMVGQKSPCGGVERLVLIC